MATKKKATKKRAASKKKASVKKVSPKKAESKKVFYVSLTDPLSKQREVLQITADYLRMLQNIEKLQAIRTHKQELLITFNKKMNVIRSDASKLYKLLPKYALPHKVRHVEVKPVEKEVAQKAVSKAKPSAEIDSLEAELAAIENRLSGM